MTSRHFHRGDDRGGDPQPGHYLIRLCRGGPRIPACIVHDEAAGTWAATIDGAAVGSPVADWDTHQELMKIWHHGHRSTPGEHSYLAELKSWATVHQPEHPLLHPRKPVDVAVLPPVLP